LKLERLLGITMLLLGRRRVGAQELAERFEVSLRTIYRDLETLNMAGIPVISYPGLSGGYEIMERYRLERQYLSCDELQSIVTALRGVGSALSGEELSSLIDKVIALVERSGNGSGSSSGERVLIDLHPWKEKERHQAMLRTIHEALNGCRLLSIVYLDWQGTSSERMVEPVGLALKGYIWYLHAYCLKRGDYRTFRLNRMEQLDLLPETFTRRDVDLRELDKRMACQDSLKIDLKLLFHPSVKTRVLDDYDRSFIVIRDDGWLEVADREEQGYWLYSRLLSYGPHVKVVDPPYVARKLMDQVAEIQALYEA